MGVLHRVHGHTTDLGPRVALDAVLMVGAPGLEHGLVEASSARRDADDGAAQRLQGLLDTRWQQATVVVPFALSCEMTVTYSPEAFAILPRSPALASTLNIIVPLRHASKLESVPDLEGGLLPAVQVLPRVGPLCSNEQLVVLLEAVGVPELDLGERRAAARVVHNLLDDALDEPLALGVVERAELGRSLAPLGVRLEDGAGALSLSADDTSHGRGMEGVIQSQRVATSGSWAASTTIQYFDLCAEI